MVDALKSDILLMSGSEQYQSRRHSLAPAALNVRDSYSPPAYHRDSGTSRRSGRRHSQQTLPAYSQATALDFGRRFEAGRDPHHGGQTQQHEYHLSSNDNEDGPWATLSLLTRPSSSQKNPRYYGGDMVAGVVELDLQRSLTVNSVTLTLRGQFITSALSDGSYTFLNQTITVWDKNASETQTGNRPSPLDIDRGKRNRFNARLQGKYSWPFSFPFPEEICLLQKGSRSRQQIVPTPQTFLERGTNANIQYQLVMHITHGLFRSNSKLQANISYIPSITPPPPSFLRQQAYQHGGHLFPPSEDPQGWHISPSQPFSVIYNGVSFDLTYSVSLASPLSYTRGTVIPCFVKIASALPMPLNLASLLLPTNDPFLSLVLYRRIRHLQNSQQAATRTVVALLSLSHQNQPNDALESVHVEEFGKAVFWEPQSNANRLGPSNQVCNLEGEIHLSSELQPSCQVGFFTVEYFVCLMASKEATNTRIPVSLPSNGPTFPLQQEFSSSHNLQPVSEQTCPVQIGTFHLTGPLPTPFTVPSTSRHAGSRSPRSVGRARGNGSEVQELEVVNRFG
ncbi:hypothetical protein FA15DRAFT_632925 [Coprinopsis marcescibilis]|uniref:Arrestin-like N-terminal domain-containing protein n=1 Tax=Coprinopsis marcescibilis TaxID=230819 RepID=A0A5C3L908_COPMA|nr:hypothetical protein FA15DRAFT_632925 [Coprinopsis marcescibilis]